MVTAGIWVQQQRNGFDYDNATQIAAQRDAVRKAVPAREFYPLSS